MERPNILIAIFVLLLAVNGVIMEVDFSLREKALTQEISGIRQELLLIKELPKDSTTLGDYHNDGGVNHEQFQDIVITDLSKRLGNIENKVGRY